MLPWLTINFFVKDKFDALWELEKAFKIVTKNFTEYLLALVKTVIFCVIYYLLCFVLVGIPCLQFGSMYYLAKFYKDHH
jgi:hypothetical protein